MINTSSNWWWANEDSRTFLSRGYIDGNMTAEERVPTGFRICITQI